MNVDGAENRQKCARSKGENSLGVVVDTVQITDVLGGIRPIAQGGSTQYALMNHDMHAVI